MENENKPKVVISGDNLAPSYSSDQKKQISDTLKTMIGFIKKKDYAQIIDFASNKIKDLPNQPIGEGYKDLSEIYGILATAYYETNQRGKETLDLALKAIGFNRQSQPAMWLIRELGNEYSAEAIYYRLKVDGEITIDMKDEVITNKFRTIYSVLADSPEEAMDYIRKFERYEIKDTLELSKASEIGKKPDLPKGVYETMKLISWDQDLFDSAKEDRKD